MATKDIKYAWVEDIIVEGQPLWAVIKEDIHCAMILNFKLRCGLTCAQLVKIAKAIPTMIQHAINIAMKHMVEKLSNLSGRVDILVEEVDAWRMELERRKGLGLSMEMDLNIPPVVPSSPVIYRSLVDDW
ncbi:hypothetical protein HAX54_024796 [Datura stramonium]|uniref:Uncharacterized protein n=1 Tax=Datura stramonium TaxID=4076 RepID=A0ABS8UZ72_DATST|nr:hypothetical protein [Datura stramonium]